MEYNENIKNIIKKIPQKPGIYFFINTENEIIYIGKATNLNTRILSYFSKDIYQKRGPIIAKMVEEIDDIKTKITDNSIEALILESHKIKQNQPKYNIKEKSGKSFVYLVVTNDEFPKFLIKREKEILEKKFFLLKENKKIKTIGPFSSHNNLEKSLQIIRKIFPFYSNEKSYNNQSNLYQQIGLSPDNTEIDIKNSEKYKENIKNIILFFEGKKKKILKIFEEKMHEYAKKEEFELADLYKKKIEALKNISDFQINLSEDDLFFKEKIRIEAYDIAHLQGDAHVGVMTVVENGQEKKSEYRKFIIKSYTGIDDNRSLREILNRRFSHQKWEYPNIIVADGGIAQKRTIENFLRNNKDIINKEISVVACKKDKTHKVVSIIGNRDIILKNKKFILLANSEAHRFAIEFHRKKRDDEFLK